MFCSHCGSQLQDGAKFCTNCGAPTSPSNDMNYDNYGQYYQNPYQYSGPEMVEKKVRRPNIIGIVAGICAILCTFLTYAKASLWGVESTQTLIKGGDGVFFIILGVLVIIFALFDMEIGVLIVGILTSILTIFEVYDFSDKVNDNIFGDVIERGIGFYLMIIAAIVMVLAGPLWKMITKRQQ